MSVISDAEHQAEAVERIAHEHPESVLVLATYTREEFEEIRSKENYDRFKMGERLFLEMLDPDVAARIVFQDIDSAGFYRYLAKSGMKNDEAGRAAYATLLYTESASKRDDPGLDVL